MVHVDIRVEIYTVSIFTFLIASVIGYGSIFRILWKHRCKKKKKQKE